MEERNIELSQDYYKRKNHLLKKRLNFFIILISSVSFLLFLSISEGYALKILLSKNFSITDIVYILLLIELYLLTYNIILSRITLHLCYYFYNKKIPSIIIMSIFSIVYLIISFNVSEAKNIIPLGISKICIISLFFNFWSSKLSETRLETRSNILPYIFMISWQAFFMCRWVLIACWLLSSLGFALALVTSHPIIKIELWEAVLLMLAFYFPFKLFVRNPNAHSGF